MRSFTPLFRLPIQRFNFKPLSSSNFTPQLPTRLQFPSPHLPHFRRGRERVERRVVSWRRSEVRHGEKHSPPPLLHRVAREKPALRPRSVPIRGPSCLPVVLCFPSIITLPPLRHFAPIAPSSFLHLLCNSSFISFPFSLSSLPLLLPSHPSSFPYFFLYRETLL